MENEINEYSSLVGRLVAKQMFRNVNALYIDVLDKYESLSNDDFHKWLEEQISKTDMD